MLPRCPALQDTFFKKLPNLLPSIPTPVAQRKLLPMLANAIEFGGAPPVSLDCCSMNPGLSALAKLPALKVCFTNAGEARLAGGRRIEALTYQQCWVLLSPALLALLCRWR